MKTVRLLESAVRPALLAMAMVLAILSPVASFAYTTPLTLATTYRAGLHLPDYWVSEKYDGVRGHWTGTQFITRQGLPIAAPAWFTQGWPSFAVDGELWAGRGQFAVAQSTISQTHASDAAWKNMRYMVFDLPSHAGVFDERLMALQAWAKDRQSHGQSWVQAVPQQRVTTERQLQQLLQRTVRAGGEGLMLHKGSALYTAGRSGDLIKLKPYDDSEARVVAHLPGRGKHEGRLGALLVEIPGGQRFKLGAGFSDAERENPPPIGSWITYRYQGSHASGLPRFARFMRVRNDGFKPPERPETAAKDPLRN